jgi:hypothetical protein
MRAALEEVAWREGRSVAQLLDEIVAAKLDTSSAEPEEDDRQRRLHDRAADFAGSYQGRIASEPQRRGSSSGAA